MPGTAAAHSARSNRFAGRVARAARPDRNPPGSGGGNDPEHLLPFGARERGRFAGVPQATSQSTPAGRGCRDARREPPGWRLLPISGEPTPAGWLGSAINPPRSRAAGFSRRPAACAVVTAGAEPICHSTSGTQRRLVERAIGAKRGHQRCSTPNQVHTFTSLYRPLYLPLLSRYRTPRPGMPSQYGWLGAPCSFTRSGRANACR